VPNAAPTVSRRHVLIGVAALALGGAVAACGSPSTPDPAVDVLTGQLEQARADSTLAGAAAASAPPPLAAALGAVAAIRDAHGRALSDELARLGSVTTTTTTPTTTLPAAPAATPQQVRAALQQSATAAGQAAAGQSGYRAGLLASIAAACTTAATVNLAGVAA